MARVRCVLLLAEDLLLLLTDDTSGRLPANESVVDALLAGANLIELTLMGRVDIPHVGKPVRYIGIDWWAGRTVVGRFIVRDPSPTDDEVLDAAMQIVMGNKSKYLHAVLRQLSNERLHWTLYNRLARRGMVRSVQDSPYGVEMRRRVIQALVERTPPDTRSAALIALLHTIKHEPGIIYPRARIVGLTRTHRQLIARGDEIAKSNWAPEAVREAIDAMITTISWAARMRG
jgi:Golgi phosphoprotein 3 (GPP34)